METRLCLALLYGLLFRYRLREAQALGDHMAAVLQAQMEAPRPGRTHREAACAVVQSLGRFMASYFTNQPLLILHPHSVLPQPPPHLPPRPNPHTNPTSTATPAPPNTTPHTYTHPTPLSSPSLYPPPRHSHLTTPHRHPH